MPEQFRQRHHLLGGKSDETHLSPSCCDRRATNVRPQKQPGFAIAVATVPLGDLTAAQMRVVGELATLVAASLALRMLEASSRDDGMPLRAASSPASGNSQ